MSITGENLIGANAVRGSGEAFEAVEAATGKTLAPSFHSATPADLDRAAVLADEAFATYSETDPETRAAFLERIADEIGAIGDELISRAIAETGLPRARLEGERGRTVGQLKMFAGVVRDGSFLDVRIEPALPGRKPLPRPDLRLRNVALGPVAVFGASNFPLAFSVAGGDTASALAAGCPVIVKAHPAHPGVSELVGRAVQRAVAACGLPEGVFSLLFDAGRTIGQALVADPRIAAVGFTGSRAGGLALMKIARERETPIPVYAEMSSVNPVVLMPGALEAGAETIAKNFVGALTLGAGQFCTNPGLILGLAGAGLDRFLTAAGEALENTAAATMLTRGIRESYGAGVAKLAAHPQVSEAARGKAGDEGHAQASLFVVDGGAFIADPALQTEIFGATALVVACKNLDQLRAVLKNLEGQLTAALHIVEADHEAARSLLPLIERKVGRILVNGFGTGVEVGHAMVHGGPFPATSDGRSTSVGSLAIARFLRPLCYQDVPDALLAKALKSDNPLQAPRRMDGAAPTR